MHDRAERADHLETLLATMVACAGGHPAANAAGHVDDLRAAVWGPPEVGPDESVLDAATEELAAAELAAFFAAWERDNP